MRRSSGFTWVLLSAAVVVVVLAVIRIPTGGERERKRDASGPGGSVASRPEEPENTPEQIALLERIFAAWKKRQDAAATFHFVWDSRVTRPAADANVAVPPSGWWEDRDGRFREDSVLLDYDDNGLWRQIASVRLIHDGHLNSRLTVPHGTGGSPWITIWRGSVRNRTSRYIPRLLVINGRWQSIPVVLAVRPLSAAPDLSPAKWQVVSEEAVANNVRCVEIHKRNRYSQYDIFWVDPQRDDVVVRWKGGNSSGVLDIDYQRDPKHGWLPSHWSWSDAGPGKWLLFDETVRSYSIGEALPAETFAHTQPANTVVYDATAGSEMDWKREQSPPDESKGARTALDAVATAWAKRKAKVQSLDVTWRQSRTFNGDGWLHGPVTTNYTARVQGDRFEVESTGPGSIPRYPGSHNGYGFFHDYEKTAFDGVVTRGLKDRKGSGWIRTGPAFDGSDGNDCVWLAVCPWDGRLTGLDPAKFRLVAADTKVGDANCVMVRSDSRGWPSFLWLDRARDFLVLRKHEVTDGVHSIRADFSYRADANHGWVPTGWNESNVGWWWNSGYSLDDGVNEVAINRPIAASAFTIDFPKEAPIQDLDPEPLRNEKARNQVATAIAERWAKPLDEKAPPKPQFDPKFDARVELEKALKAARETKRRVLIEFGGQASRDCVKLNEALTQNAEIAASVRKSFVLLLVDADYRDAGQIVLNQYVPENKQGGLPLVTVMDPDETVLDTSDTTALKTGDAYAVDRLKAYLEKWSPKK